MDLSVATTTSTYNYQTALKTVTKGSLTPQVLPQTNANQDTRVPGATDAPEVLAELAGSSAPSPLVSGNYSGSVANGSPSVESHDVNLIGGASSGLPSLNLAAAEALAAYRHQQILTGSPSSSFSAAATYVQQVSLTTQASSLTGKLNLLA